MKYAFIVNPASGKGRHDRTLIPEISKLKENHPDKDIDIYYTLGERDATVLADMIAREAGDDVVIFACGGDGTVNEAVNGIYGHENAVLGVVPVGSGDDFARDLARKSGSGRSYLDLEAQLDGSISLIDLIRLSWTADGREEIRYVANGINIGFDGNTAILAHDLKKLPGVSGSWSYMLAVARNLALKKGQRLRITADGSEFYSGDLLLATAANGGYCGGGVQSCPNADLSDGLIELLAVRDIPRRRFVALFPKYKAGKIFSIDGADEIFSYTQAKSIVIEPMLGPEMQFVGDGEIFCTGALHADIMPQAIRVLMV